MSRWIYLEPDFPPTASEGASGRARSQAREMEVGEGDSGTREGCIVSDGLAGCPNAIRHPRVNLSLVTALAFSPGMGRTF